MTPREQAERILQLIEVQDAVRRQSLNLSAAENVTSPAVRRAVASDFQHRYHATGTQQLDEIMRLGEAAARRLFRAEHVSLKPVSGQQILLAALLTYAQPGDEVLLLREDHGAHALTALCEAAGRRPLYFPFDVEAFNIDVEATRVVLQTHKPSLLIYNMNCCLFPLPVHALQDAAPTVCYDAAHPLGLIAAGVFQDPLREGAHLVHGSTHKTLPGPQKGLIASSDAARFSQLQRVLGAATANYHLHHVVALSVALLELEAFGREYATQTIANAQALAQALRDQGFSVVGAAQGFTRSHTVLLDVREFGGGLHVSKLLDAANILSTWVPLPGDWGTSRLSGLRLGTQEVTRLGLRPADMPVIAALIGDLLLRDRSTNEVQNQVRELMVSHQEVGFHFGHLNAEIAPHASP